MDTKYFVVNDGGQTEIVEYLRAVSPHVDGSIFPQTLIIKTIHLCNLAGLVIAADESDAVGVTDLDLMKFKCIEINIQ